jgi:integrase
MRCPKAKEGTMKPFTAPELAELKKQPRKPLTVRKIEALRPAPSGVRYEIMDTVVSGFGVRVTDRGKRTFVLVGRFPGGKNPTRREIAEVGELTLEAARDKAREWVALIKKGTDPKVEEERRRQAELRKQKHTFTAVAEEYLKRHVKPLRSAKKTEQAIRRELLPKLGPKPIVEITREEVNDLLRAIIDRPAPRMAELIYHHLKSIFSWAESEGTYGIETAPTDKIKPKKFFGVHKPRTRVLDDNELWAFWRATSRMGYPFGPLFKVLLLTGARETEIGSASWTEISPDGALLTIPPTRFKSEVVHLIPLSTEARAVLEALPRFTRSKFIFSARLGAQPVSNFGKAKERLYEYMAEELGHDPEPFVIHDLRRTVRTRLSSLRIPFEVAELVVGHAKRGLARVYDQHEYLEEMRDALEQWATRLRSIITPLPPNVLQFGARASA